MTVYDVVKLDMKITDEEGADLMRIAQTNRDAAEKYMERLSAL